MVLASVPQIELISRILGVGIGIGVAIGVDSESDSDPDTERYEHEHSQQVLFMRLGVPPAHGSLFHKKG